MVELVERAVVRVGGVEIPAGAIAAEVQNHPAPDADTAWQAAAEALVIRQLLLTEADRQGIIAQESRDTEGRLLIEEDARIDALLTSAVKVPSATTKEARRFYERHRTRFASETLIEAEHILIAANPSDRLAYSLAVGDVRTLIRKIQADPSRFADLAREHSACPSKAQGGNLGQIGRGQTVAAFEAALFALAEGELCVEPVRSPYGVHVVRAGRRIDGQPLPFEVVEPTIRDYLEEASARRATAQYLAILASETPVEGVTLPIAEGPLVQ
ncbi:peptidylprolyl isomerase [Sphingosinicella microcystinivorans]|jgi:peptidyl-prolyl cis-trans isomerase C|uniref:Parvulin-like PPIase n=1 Tax=Sphingosinicella microcystinivorans TaxID=335406 RepID=A0AAD1DAM3_SPHMI|nr:peptidylprolyl isomerase [Sphingosinicella microcystinivorans]RKS88318.1 peptidyl-prolyl cis-trans isomerase C [Sphingosinicella microcystinivorans]BBE36129.1 peptidylprolyl isomerase [Sphingosinicella microcystinivorans]